MADMKDEVAYLKEQEASMSKVSAALKHTISFTDTFVGKQGDVCRAQRVAS